MPRLVGRSRLLFSVCALAVILSSCTRSSPSGVGSTPTTPPAATSTLPPTLPSTSPTPTPSVSGGPCANESPVPLESPVSIESVPPGDIPDAIQYPVYDSKSAPFTFVHPEGWSQKNGTTTVTFTQTLFAIRASWGPAPAAPTVASAKSQDVPALQCTEMAFVLESVESVSLPGGPAVLIRFQENSVPDPNSVTVKQTRLEVFRYEFYKAGVVAALSLSAPVGSDVVDPWRIVTESFKWK